MKLTAEVLKLELQPFEVRRPDEFQSVVLRMIKTGIDAVAISNDSIFIGNARRMAEITANNQLPSVGFVEYAQAGGLVGYGPNLQDLWYRGAFFVDKILKGAKPADLPVEQPTKFDLVINLKTAKTIGLTVPPTLLARADEVIE